MRALVRWTALLALSGCGAPRPANTEEPVTVAAAPAPEPPSDRDGDLILDRCDACPDVREDYDQTNDDDGCPEEFRIESSNHPAQDVVYFSRGSAALDDFAERHLGRAVETFRRSLTVAVVCVGHGGRDEPDALLLSRRRADAVCEALRARGAAETTVTHAAGDTQRGTLPDVEQARAVSVLQLSGRLLDHWYRPLYVYGEWVDGQFAGRWELRENAPTGPARCPHE